MSMPLRVVLSAFVLAFFLFASLFASQGIADAQPRKRNRAKKAAPKTTEKAKPSADKTSDKTDEKEGKSSADKADPAKNEVGVKTRKGKRAKEKLFDFTALQLDGSTRMPQLLYFLERASEELQRASLKRRSFVPEMVRSLDEDAL